MSYGTADSVKCKIGTFNPLHTRVAQNLYENGYVCLSLLGTWNGKAAECWNPESSTLLQVTTSAPIKYIVS